MTKLESDDTSALSMTDLPDISSLKFGCVFCQTGHEDAAMRYMVESENVFKAFVAKKSEHRSRNGIKSVVEKIIFPGYVFFIANQEWAPKPDYKGKNYIIRLLTIENSWHLKGTDEEFVRWLWERDGLLGLSKAYKEGDRVMIQQGPLKDLEGYITKVDRHNRNGQVKIELFGKKIVVWLAFEMLEKGAGL